jgi:hypothetical protein
MWPGAAVERKVGGRHHGARAWSNSDTAMIFLKRNYGTREADKKTSWISWSTNGAIGMDRRPGKSID